MSKIKKNYIFSVIYQFLNIVVPLITTPYVSRVIGVSGIGYNSYVASIVNYFSIFIILGTYTYGQKEIGSNQNNKENYTKIFINILVLKIILGIIGILVYFLSIPLFDNNLRLLFLIRSMTLLANMLDVSWFFQGMENFQITATRQMAIRIIGACAVFAFVREPEHLFLYAGIDAGLALIGNISILPYLTRYIDIYNIKNNFNLKYRFNLFSHLNGTVSLFIPQIATSLYMSLDKSMIGYYFKDGIESGYYEQATKIHMMGLALIVALSTVLIPRIALLYTEKNIKEMNRILSNGITYILFIGSPLALGVSAIGFNFLPWFLGEQFIKSADILQITALLIFIMGITNFLGYGYMVATNQNQIYTISVTSGTIINFLINCILIPKFGALGAAVASLTSEIFVLFFQITYIQKTVKISTFFYQGKQYIFSAILMGIISTYLSQKLLPTLFNTIFIAFFGITSYIVLLLIFRDQYTRKILSIINNKVREKLCSNFLFKN